MTTKTERKFIYDLFTELKKRRKDHEDLFNKTSGPTRGFGVCDEEEYNREFTEYAALKAGHLGCVKTIESIWEFVKTKYTKWDIELAIQENEERIGELKYER